MNRKTKIATAAGATFVALAGLGGAVLAANTLLDKEKTERFTITQPVTKVVVSSEAGDVEVVATDTDRITVTQTAHWVTDEPSPSSSVSNGVLRLGDESGGWAIFRSQTDYRIEVPRDLAVEVDAEAGDVTVTGLAGSVTVASEAGDVTGERLAADRVHADSEAGDVELEFAAAPSAVDATSEAGDVEIDLPSDEYALEVDTEAGDESVEGIVEYDASPRTVTVSTEAGDVTIHGR